MPKIIKVSKNLTTRLTVSFYVGTQSGHFLFDLSNWRIVKAAIRFWPV